MNNNTNFNNFERELDWDAEIVKDSEFVLLQPGLYQFTCLGYERTQHEPTNPNSKLPRCKKAIVSLKIETNEGETTLKHNLFLHNCVEGLLSAFFGAIGLKKKGEPFNMGPAWAQIAGTTGVCKVGIREYNGNQYNEVKSMIYKDDVDITKVLNVQNPFAQQQPNFNQPQQQPQQPTWNNQGNNTQGGF
jgi:hypothetical protein